MKFHTLDSPNAIIELMGADINITIMPRQIDEERCGAVSDIYKIEVALSRLSLNDLEELLPPGRWLTFGADTPDRLYLLCPEDILLQLQWHDIVSGQRTILAQTRLSPAQLAQYRTQLGDLPWEDEPYLE